MGIEQADEDERKVRWDAKRRVLAIETAVPSAWGKYFDLREEFLARCRHEVGNRACDDAWPLDGEPEAVRDGHEPGDFWIDATQEAMRFLLEDEDTWWDAYGMHDDWNGVATVRAIAETMGLSEDEMGGVRIIEAAVAARDVAGLIAGFMCLGGALIGRREATR